LLRVGKKIAEKEEIKTKKVYKNTNPGEANSEMAHFTENFNWIKGHVICHEDIQSCIVQLRMINNTYEIENNHSEP
jgi:hypothetical protein